MSLEEAQPWQNSSGHQPPAVQQIRKQMSTSVLKRAGGTRTFMTLLSSDLAWPTGLCQCWLPQRRCDESQSRGPKRFTATLRLLPADHIASIRLYLLLKGFSFRGKWVSFLNTGQGADVLRRRRLRVRAECTMTRKQIHSYDCLEGQTHCASLS